MTREWIIHNSYGRQSVGTKSLFLGLSLRKVGPYRPYFPSAARCVRRGAPHVGVEARRGDVERGRETDLRGGAVRLHLAPPEGVHSRHPCSAAAWDQIPSSPRQRGIWHAGLCNVEKFRMRISPPYPARKHAGTVGERAAAQCWPVTNQYPKDPVTFPAKILEQSPHPDPIPQLARNTPWRSSAHGLMIHSLLGGSHQPLAHEGWASAQRFALPTPICEQYWNRDPLATSRRAPPRRRGAPRCGGFHDPQTRNGRSTEIEALARRCFFEKPSRTEHFHEAIRRGRTDRRANDGGQRPIGEPVRASKDAARRAPQAPEAVGRHSWSCAA